MSIIKDVFFGGAEKKAAKAQQAGIEAGIDATQQATAQARSDLFDIFPQAQQTAQQGFQGALDVFSQSAPAQLDVFQQGNMNAQNAILAGMPQIQNALFGNQVDYSAFQPSSIQSPDLGFLSQTLPQIQQQEQAAAVQALADKQASDAIAAGMGTGQGNSPVPAGMNFSNNNLARYLAGGGNSDFFNKGIQWP
jgi:hypothetical protein